MMIMMMSQSLLPNNCSCSLADLLTEAPIYVHLLTQLLVTNLGTNTHVTCTGVTDPVTGYYLVTKTRVTCTGVTDSIIRYKFLSY